MSIKDLEIKTSKLFTLHFANNIILSCFFFFSLIIDLYFLIPAVIAQILHIIPIKIPRKVTKTEIDVHPVTK